MAFFCAEDSWTTARPTRSSTGFLAASRGLPNRRLWHVKPTHRVPIDADMRQVLHKLIGAFFWLVLVGCWARLITEGKAGIPNITYSVEYLAAVAAAVLGVTLLWIRHNTSIYRRKGPRHGRPDVLPRTDEDRLGRPLRWQLDGGPIAALGVHHLVVELDDGVKVYRRAA